MSPNNKKRLPASPDEWIIHAESDLNLAKMASKSENILNEQICFHAQQAAEKAIKAVLLFYKIDFPLTHDIDELIDLLEDTDITLPNDISEGVSILTPYAVETRYPGFWEEVTEYDVKIAIETAEKVLLWAKDIIKTD